MYNPKKLEEDIEKFWRDNDIQKKAKEVRKDGEKFFFLDGPPYATGAIHMGTAWNKIMKDAFIRFFRMQGMNVWAQPGYDTHGLPIENKVQEELGIDNKQDIEKFGVEEFTKKCRDFVDRHIEMMNGQFKQLGVWMDWDNPYATLHNSYIEGAWHTFKEAYKKDLLYKGIYPVHLCPHCETAVAYNEVEYYKTQDPSIFVKLKLHGKENEYLVIWTTTPWTIPSNVGVMVNPKFDYSKVKVGEDVLIIAKELVESVAKRCKLTDYEIIETVKGEDLTEMKYDHPLANLVNFEEDFSNAYRIIPSEQHVTLDAGTGLVHTAPGHGSEDFKEGKKHGLPVVCPIKLDGTYDDRVKSLENKFVKDADDEIIEELKIRNALLGKETITHDYPKCWRCKYPLLQVAIPQWFFRITSIRKRLLEENKDVNWVPEWAGQRFENWLMSLGDWPISRQRYWGTPLPIWECSECENVKVLGSREELGQELDDLHRPYIDSVKIDCDCGGKMDRIEDVLDVWFDAGVAPWASLEYVKDKTTFEKFWPVDLIMEGPDQIRGWWNALMITSVITFDRRSFENVMFHGFVMDSKGKKMSKSIGNIVQPEEVIEKYGRDILRYYLLSSPPENNFFFSWDEVKDSFKFFNTLANCVNFMETYSEDASEKNLREEDKWILSKVNTLTKDVKEKIEHHQLYRAVRMISDFILNDLSRTYIKLIRDRTSPSYDGEDKNAAFWTLREVLKKTSVILAPVCPYITEHIYQKVKRDDGPESIHLLQWEIDDTRFDFELESKFEILENVLEATNSLRQENEIGLRYPIKSITISGPEKTKNNVKDLENLIIELANTKEINYGKETAELDVKPDYKSLGKKYGKHVPIIVKGLTEEKISEVIGNGESQIDEHKITKDDLIITEHVSGDGRIFKSSHGSGVVQIDTTETQEILDESLVRELIRKVQERRKELGLKVADSVTLIVKDDNNVVEKWKDVIEKETGSKIEIGEGAEVKAEYKGREVLFDVQS